MDPTHIDRYAFHHFPLHLLSIINSSAKSLFIFNCSLLRQTPHPAIFHPNYFCDGRVTNHGLPVCAGGCGTRSET